LIGGCVKVVGRFRNLATQIELLGVSGFHPLVIFTTVTTGLAPLGAGALFFPKSNAWYAEMKSYRAAA